MAEKIDLEVPATLSALSTVRMVLGGLGARLDFSIDELEDLYLATGELLRAALVSESLERLSVHIVVDDGGLRISTGSFKSSALRSEVTVHAERCLDLCMLLQSTMDEVGVEDGGGQYHVVLVKRGGEDRQ
jgi:anti-sigma regulatory factor (Ser/Thr protein kinase)